MMDIMGGLTAANEALKLTKELRSIDSELDKADLKLRLADLIDKLLEAKEALQNAKEEEFSLKERIRDLESKFNEEGSAELRDGMLFLSQKEPEEGPFCNFCFRRDGKLLPLRSARLASGHDFFCDNCKSPQGPKYRRNAGAVVSRNRRKF